MLTADTLYELSKHPNINGLKAASGNFSLLAEAMAKCGDNLNVWSGNDDQIVPLMSLGGKGVISVLSNVARRLHTTLLSCALTTVIRKLLSCSCSITI